MGSNIDTHLGNITIANEVIAQYAGTVATECFGIVGMASVNMKEGLVKLLKKDSVGHGIRVKTTAKGIALEFHIIVAYGVSILAVTDNLIKDVKYKLEEMTGLKVEKVNVIIEGVRVID